MKKCYAKIEYKDGHITIEERSLKGGLSFGLKEMEKWIKEDPKVKRAKCFVNNPLLNEGGGNGKKENSSKATKEYAG